MLKDIAESYRAEALRLQTEIDKARKQYRKTGLYADKARLRLLWEIRRDLSLLADYLEGYYDRKFAYTKKEVRTTDFFGFEKRSSRSGKWNVERFAAISGSAEKTGSGCYGEGADTDTEGSFVYVPFGNESP